MKTKESILKFYKAKLLIMVKILFSDTYKNAKTNASNCSYWSKMFRQIEEIGDYQNEWVRRYKTTNPLFPIFVYQSKLLQKMVRIQQINPEELEDDDVDVDERHYITAWIDEAFIDEVNYNELVIVLLLTPQNAEIAHELISCWFKQEDDTLRSIIAEIYSHHPKEQI